VVTQQIGALGEINLKVRENLDIKRQVFGLEIDYSALEKYISDPIYKPIGKYPSVKEEFSIFLPHGAELSKVISMVKDAAPDNIKTIKLKESNIVEGKRAELLSIEYYSATHTLKDSEISTLRGQILEALKKAGATPRI
jgi:phenylalanyl-tRNA synthetase beta subunit